MQHNNVIPYRSRARRKGVSKLFWLLLLFFTVSALFVIYLASPLALVASIEVTGNDYLKESEILDATGLEVGLNLWRLNLTDSRDKLSINPWVSNVRISRVFPNSLSVAVEERQGHAVLYGAAESWVVAEDGMVLAVNDGWSLPWITGLEMPDLHPADYAQGQPFKLALDWVTAFQPLNSQVSELNFESYPAHISVFTTDGFKVLLPTDSNLEQRVWDMNALLQELRSSNQKGVIDFRTGEGRGIFSPWLDEEAGTGN